MTNIPTTKDTAKALQAFKKAAQKSTTNSLFTGRETIIPIFAKSDDKNYNN